MAKQIMKVYEYPIRHPDGHIYYGSYSIKEGTKPLHFKGEKCVQKFETNVLGNNEINFMKVNSISDLLRKMEEINDDQTRKTQN